MKNIFDKAQHSTIEVSKLKQPSWRATHVLKPDLELLRDSIIEYGLLSPLVVRAKTMQIIDGYHRWTVIRSSKELMKRYDGVVGAVIFDIDEIDAMVMHLRLNRGRGNIFASNMSTIVKDVCYSGKYDSEELRKILSMNVMEMDVLLDGTLLKSRKVKDHTYSKAWVPIEVPSGKPDNAILERPPNADR
jgi:hypothetical protein